MSTYILEKFCIISFLFSSITLNVNCGHSNSQRTPMTDTLKIEGCQAKISVKLGSVLELKLEATPGTGSQWLLKDSSQLLQLLDADNLKFSTPETKEPIVGQSGHQRLHFRTKKKGEETIHLIYKRTWEAESTNSCDIKIEVN